MAVAPISHRMSADELDGALSELGCTASEIAACLDVHPDTIKLWLRGEMAVPGPAALTIGFMLVTVRSASGVPGRLH